MVRRTFIQKLLFVFILFSISLNSALATSNIVELPSSHSGSTFPEYIKNEVIVQFKANLAPSKHNLRIGGERSIKTGNQYFSVLRMSSTQSVEEVIADYQQKGLVEYVEPNYIAHAFAHFTPNDEYYKYQWNIINETYVNIRRAWDISTGKGVIVAVLDSGVAYENYGQYRQAPDLASTHFVPGYDFLEEDAHPNDESGHGTHVAGVIAQSTNNGIGTAGVAFDAQIMPVRVLDSDNKASYANLAAGIYYAVDHGANVINISVGGVASSVTLERAVKYAYERGVTVIAAAGNYFLKGNPTTYPAAYDDYVIAVGATRYDGQRAPYSNTGNYIDLVAPGGDLMLDQNMDGYGDGILQQTFVGNPALFNYYFCEGTSLAAPHITGVAALLIANGVTAPNDIRTALIATAVDYGGKGWDEKFGFGMVDAYAALMYDGKTAQDIHSSRTISPSTDAIKQGLTSFKNTNRDADSFSALHLADEIREVNFLGQNYPNPFNAETWIPFQVATDSHVLICIFDVQGKEIRTLDLGYTSAGKYVTRNAAAYWDGKNQTGEKVASGVYFYQIQTGRFSATRRMVIAK